MPWIAAGGAVLGGALSGGLFSGSDSGPSFADVQFGQSLAKRNLLFGNPKFQRGGIDAPGAVPGLDIRTPFSSVNAGTGNVSLDPKAREMTLGSYNTFASQLGETRNSLIGNQGAFQQARVNPLLEQLAAGRGLLQRNTQRTGVRGTLADRALQSYDIAGNRAVADQRALATQEAITAINAIDQLQFNAGSGTATNLFNQQLAELGFGLDTINIINSLANNLSIGAGNIAQASSASSAIIDQARSENITAAIGAGLSAFRSSPTTTNSGFTGSSLHGIYGDG